jgi:hypothetical protein
MEKQRGYFNVQLNKCICKDCLHDNHQDMPNDLKELNEHLKKYDLICNVCKKHF